MEEVLKLRRQGTVTAACVMMIFSLINFISYMIVYRCMHMQIVGLCMFMWWGGEERQEEEGEM